MTAAASTSAAPAAPLAAAAAAAPAAPAASEDGWAILATYFRDHFYPWTKHHLDSYREFLRTFIPKTIATYNPITMIKTDTDGNTTLKVEVFVGAGGGLYLDRPVIYDSDREPILLTPQEARLRNLTYQTQLSADVEVVYTKEDQSVVRKSFAKVPIGAIPLMVHSDACILNGQGSQVLRQMSECVYDAGGYFIIDGKEKVIIAQERIATNRLFVSKLEGDPNFAYKAIVRCTGETGENTVVPRTVEFVLVKRPDLGVEEDVVEEFAHLKGVIMVSVPGIAGRIPLPTLFRALGVETDRDIVECIVGAEGSAVPEAFYDFLRPSIAAPHAIAAAAAAKLGAGTKRRRGAAVGAGAEAAEDAEAEAEGTEAAEGPRGPMTQVEALDLIRRRVYYESTYHARVILTNDLFPNIPGGFADKAKYLGYLVGQFMRVALGILPESDRDGYIFKRVDISGFLLAQLFQTVYNTFRKNCRNVLDHEYFYGPWKNTGDIEELVNPNNLSRLFNAVQVSETFQRSLKGAWGPKTDDPEQGLVQDLSRISYIGFMSHLRRVNLPLDRSIKVVSPHRLHPQQWGVMCPFESPDGASIGYLKNFALLTYITFGTDPGPIRECLRDLGVVPLSMVAGASVAMVAGGDITRVFVNGDLFGITMDPAKLCERLRLLRRTGLLNPFVSVSWDIRCGDIRVLCEAGRPCRPLRILGGGAASAAASAPAAASWFDYIIGTFLDKSERTEEIYYRGGEYRVPELMEARGFRDADAFYAALEKKRGSIEFLDIEEENTMLIALPGAGAGVGAAATHAEIEPATLLSIVSNNIPFAHHNFAPRNCFYGSQSKQAIGVHTTNFPKRFDTAAYLHHYPQRPLITTRTAHYTGNDRMPNGFNCIVAVANYTGFNQEDGLIINKNAIDRGLFQITAYKTMSASEKIENEHDQLIFANPIQMRDVAGKAVERIQRANYTVLDDRGFIKEETYIPPGESAAVIGMVHIRDEIREETRGILAEKVVHRTIRDMSKITDVHHYGKIDSVFVGSRGVGGGVSERICKVRFRKVRRPTLGDKGCSRCAQKGVIGMILPAEAMPFTAEGIIPDLIINPHAFPSRMTIAHLVECVFAKLCCLKGMLGDGTVFLPFSMEDMFGELGAVEGGRFEKHGNEVMYNGMTGEQIATEIFLGPTFYLRLKHMVADKMHARDRGPRMQLTHQPTSGRAKGGGLRIGEMERDVLLAHGFSAFAKESMMEKADAYTWAVCRQCGTLAARYPGSCSCGSQELSVVQTPYAFKLLTQELEGMGISVRLSSDPFAQPEPEAEDEAAEAQEGGGLPGVSVKHYLDEIEEQQDAEAAAAEAEEDAAAEAEELAEVAEGEKVLADTFATSRMVLDGLENRDAVNPDVLSDNGENPDPDGAAAGAQDIAEGLVLTERPPPLKMPEMEPSAESEEPEIPSPPEQRIEMPKGERELGTAPAPATAAADEIKVIEINGPASMFSSGGSSARRSGAAAAEERDEYDDDEDADDDDFFG